MDYKIDDKELNASTFISFANRVWQGEYDVERTQSALSKTLNITAYDNQVLILTTNKAADRRAYGEGVEERL